MTAEGLPVPVNPFDLIEHVFVSPFAPEWFSDVVKTSTASLGGGISVEHSSMSGTPFY
jgi:hypothetical protein